jgi:hypothetical protein
MYSYIYHIHIYIHRYKYPEKREDVLQGNQERSGIRIERVEVRGVEIKVQGLKEVHMYKYHVICIIYIRIHRKIKVA